MTGKKQPKQPAPNTTHPGALVSVYHNIALDSQGAHLGFFGYEPDHPVTLVYQYTTPTAGDAHALADEAYHLFNVGDDPTFGTPDDRALDYRSRRNRSLAIGDVIHTGDTWLACSHLGWSIIQTPAITDPTGPVYGTTPFE